VRLPDRGETWASDIQQMFSRIAHRYDFINRLMTLGQDVGWRKEVIQACNLQKGGKILDLGSGTGDLANEARNQYHGCQVVAADLTLAMMQVGRSRYSTNQLDWCAADASCLPFPDATFEAVVSGFLLRNVGDIHACLKELMRVLKPDGIMVALDTTRPPKNLLSPVINLYLRVIIPWMGGWISGDRQAYTYLPVSTRFFLSAEVLGYYFIQAGFRQVEFKRLMFGSIAIHWGKK